MYIVHVKQIIVSCIILLYTVHCISQAQRDIIKEESSSIKTSHSSEETGKLSFLLLFVYKFLFLRVSYL